jgi:AAA family ATP:ADP antiporter
VIYRGSDALYGWVFDALQTIGLKFAGIALWSLPVVAGWLVLSLALGRTQQRRAAAESVAVARGD